MVQYFAHFGCAYNCLGVLITAYNYFAELFDLENGKDNVVDEVFVDTSSIEEHVTVSSTEETTSLNSAPSLDNSLDDKYFSPPRPLPYDADPSHRKEYSSCQSGVSPRILSSEIHPILRSSGLQHRFKNWETLRKNKLIASTFAIAIGFPHRSKIQLWLEKIGAIEPFTGNLATCWNNIKEEEALERYKLITGNTVSLPEFQVYRKQNLDDNWLAASPDGSVDSFVYGSSSRGVLEIKCPFFDGDMREAYPLKRIPFYFISQAQGLMEIMDRDWMHFYV